MTTAPHLIERPDGTFEVYVDGKLVGYVRPSGKGWWFPTARYGVLEQAQAERSAAGCADLTRGARREPEYAHGWTMEATTFEDVAGATYSDHIAEHAAVADETGEADEWAHARAYVSDFHFFPCTAGLIDAPITPTSPTTTNPSNDEETTMSETTKKPAAKPAAPKPTVETTPEALAAQVEKVAKATRLRGVAVEVRQNGTRPVVTIEDDAGTRILAYVSPLKRGGFRIHVQDYGVERVLTVEDVAAAAALVKTSERRQPKAKKPKAAKAAAPKAAAKAAK